MIQVPVGLAPGLENRFRRFPIGAESVWIRFLQQLFSFLNGRHGASRFKKSPTHLNPGGYGFGLLRAPLWAAKSTPNPSLAGK